MIGLTLAGYRIRVDWAWIQILAYTAALSGVTGAASYAVGRLVYEHVPQVWYLFTGGAAPGETSSYHVDTITVGLSALTLPFIGLLAVAVVFLIQPIVAVEKADEERESR